MIVCVDYELLLVELDTVEMPTLIALTFKAFNCGIRSTTNGAHLAWELEALEFIAAVMHNYVVSLDEMRSLRRRIVWAAVSTSLSALLFQLLLLLSRWKSFLNLVQLITYYIKRVCELLLDDAHITYDFIYKLLKDFFDLINKTLFFSRLILPQRIGFIL
jgi:hypothetical protein